MTKALLAARKTLSAHRMTITCTDGEYRVNFRDGHEGTAYYTPDLDDAIGTGIAMNAAHPVPPAPPRGPRLSAQEQAERKRIRDAQRSMPEPARRIEY